MTLSPQRLDKAAEALTDDLRLDPRGLKRAADALWNLPDDPSSYDIAKVAITAYLSAPIWPPFNVGDRVRHVSRGELGSVIVVGETVDVQFDKPAPSGGASIGKYDELWFKIYPAGLISAELTERDAG